MLLIGIKMNKHLPVFCVGFMLYAFRPSYYITQVLYFPHLGSSVVSQELVHPLTGTSTSECHPADGVALLLK